MHCSECNAVIPSDSNFCSYCGAAVEDSHPLRWRDAHAERRLVTILFCDLVDSTGLSRRLDPEDLHALLVKYQRLCSDTVQVYGGTISRFLGDAARVVFGYPHATESDAERAVTAALELVETIPGLRSASNTKLSARVGIALGTVVAARRADTPAGQELELVGDTPNLAARLQELGEPGQVVVTSWVRDTLLTKFHFEALPATPIKGMERPLHAYAVRARGSRDEAPAVPPPLVGRRYELGQLRRIWERARSSEACTVAVLGEPGIGKTLLINTFLAKLDDGAVTIVKLRTSPLHPNTPYYPIIEFIETAGKAPAEASAIAAAGLDASTLTPEQRRALLWQVLRGEIPAQAGSNWDPQEVKDLIFELLYYQLRDAAARQPLCVVLEDLHWLDNSTRELIPRLLQALKTRPIAIILSSRQPLADNLSVDLAFTLSALDQSQSLMVARHAAGEAALEPPLVARAATISDGVPLFIREMIRHFAHRGDQGGAGPTLPGSLQQLLSVRLDALGDRRYVVAAGAVIGREFPLALLADVLETEPASLEESLAVAVAHGILFVNKDRSRCAFSHSLLHEAAYQSLLRAERARLHHSVAARLESLPESRAHLVGLHYSRAGDHAKAIGFLLAAAKANVQHAAYREAISQMEDALAHARGISNAQQQRDAELTIRSLLGPALMATEGYGAAAVVQAYTRARELCAESSESPNAFPVLFGLWGFHLVRAEYFAAYEIAAQMLRLAKRTGNTDLLIEAEGAVGVNQFYLGRLPDARTHLTNSMAQYDYSAHRSHILQYGQDPFVACAAFLCQTMWLLDAKEEARRIAQQGYQHAKKTGHPFNEVFAAFGVVMVRQFDDRPEDALVITERALEICEKRGYRFWLGIFTAIKGWAVGRLGQPRDAIGHIDRAMQIRLSMGIQVPRPYFIALLAEAYWSLGETDKARKHAAEARELVEQIGEGWCQAHIEALQQQLANPAPPVEPRPRRQRA